MAGMKFEYDESGSTFYYFLLAFYALVLLPLTYYFWPSSQSDRSDHGRRKCHCDGCQMKRHLLKSFSPWKERKKRLLKLLFFVLWIVFAVLMYKVSTIQVEWMDFDPYAVLAIDRGAVPLEIRKAYRLLSLQHHPDKGGDPLVFQQINKAYRALTNEQDRRNWEEHGNPDGPAAINFGIALPKWLVRQENSMLVLGVYGLVFMVLLPVVVGTWWYRTIKFTGEAILLHTTELFRYFLQRTPSMSHKRIIMILASALEFSRAQNPEIVERPSDNEEVPAAMKQLPQVNEKNKEPPFCAPYALKARVLLHAHLTRLELNPNTLEVDRRTVICKCPVLLQEMVTICMQLVAFSQYPGTRFIPPRLDTIECIMRLCPMVVQGLWDNKSPILQLPHISEDALRHFVTRKRSVRTIRQLVQMPDSERRALLRGLTEDQYRDVMTVCAGMPQVDVHCKVEVIDDDKPDQVTAGSLVTLTVTLTRRDLSELMSSPPSAFSAASASASALAAGDDADDGPAEAGGEDSQQQLVALAAAPSADDASAPLANGGLEANGSSPAKKPPPPPSQQQQQQQQQQQKRKRGKDNWLNKGKAKGKPRQQQQAKPQQQQQTPQQQQQTSQQQQQPNLNSSDAQEDDLPALVDMSAPIPEEVTTPLPAEAQPTAVDESATAAAADEAADDGSAGGGGGGGGGSGGGAGSGGDEDSEGEDGWGRVQEELRRDNSLETRKRTTRVVHCPLFPAEKLEFWWLYVCDRRSSKLLTNPVHVTSLDDTEQVPLRFTAPEKPGSYTYSLCLRSDSYLDLELNLPLKLDVLPASAAPKPQPVYDSSDQGNSDSGADTEPEGGGAGEVSNGGGSTDYEYSD